jgi:hypothetical protein
LKQTNKGDEWEKRRKGSLSVAEERVGAHQSIKAFFSQFNEGSDNFAVARQKLKVRKKKFQRKKEFWLILFLFVSLVLKRVLIEKTSFFLILCSRIVFSSSQLI